MWHADGQNVHKNLKVLDLSYNNLKGLPKNLDIIFPKLEYLNVNNNRICSLQGVIFPRTLRTFYCEDQDLFSELN